MELADRIVRFITWSFVVVFTVFFWAVVIGSLPGCTDAGCNNAPALESPKPSMPRLVDIIDGTWNSEEKGYATFTIWAPEAGRSANGDTLVVSGVLINNEMSRVEFVGAIFDNQLLGVLAPDYDATLPFKVVFEVIDENTVEWIEHDFVVTFHRYKP